MERLKTLARPKLVMNMDLSFESNFKLTSLAMKVNRCHPYIKRDWIWFIQFIILHAIFASFFSLLVYNIVFINLRDKDFDESCKNGTICIVYYIITLKHIIMSVNQKKIRGILDLMDEDYKYVKQLPEEEQAIMHKYIQRGSIISVQWLVVTGGGSLMFPAKNMCLLIYYWQKGDPQMIPIFDLTYPAIIRDNVDELVAYLVVYALVFYFGGYATCMYTAFTPLGPIFMMHCCSWLEIMELRLGKLFDCDVRESEENLKEIIKKSQHVYDLVDEILLSFRVIYEATVRGAVVLLPITFYEIIETAKRGEVPLEFISLIIGSILITSSPCYYSDLLMSKGESFRQATYACKWESAPPSKVQNMLRLMLVRSLRPTALRTLFKPICLETLAEVFQSAYAIFNLMNSSIE